jgi:eukaryotic-like serine/threonine-protein kinase
MKALYGLGSRSLREFSLVAPQCSLSYGAAGIAYALARAGELTLDSELLRAAEAWSELAEHRALDTKAFTSSALEITRKDTGFASLSMAEPGLFYVKSIIRSDIGDSAGADMSIGRYLTIAKRRISRVADVYLGGLGLALAAKRLMGCTRSAKLRRELSSFSREAVTRAWTTPHANILGKRRYLGFAHGVAGLVFTTYACGDPTNASPVLQELRRTASRLQRGLRWPVHANSNFFMEGWCSGVAGHLLMWTKVWQHSRDDKDFEMLDRVAWGVWESGIRLTNLCCGGAGQAIILASFSSAVGDPRWRVRAADFLNAVPSRWSKYDPPQSLFRGELGLLLAHLECEYGKPPRFPVYGEDISHAETN